MFAYSIWGAIKSSVYIQYTVRVLIAKHVWSRICVVFVCTLYLCVYGSIVT